MSYPLINGSGMLGLGINIFGNFSGGNSFKGQIFDMSAGNNTKTINGQTFSVPENASVIDSATTTGTATVFESRQTYDSHFDASAQASIRTFSFSASAQASFAKNISTMNYNSFATFDALFTRFNLNLANRGASALAQGLLQDPDYKNLPQSFTQQNKDMFFRFFAKFGTHYLSSVQMGGKLTYSVAVNNGYHYSDSDIRTKVSAEYNGVFASGSAQAQSNFQQADSNWFSNTVRKVYAEGGNASIINSVAPSCGVNNNSVWSSWVDSVDTNPSLLFFQLEPITKIFSGNQAAAVQEAYLAYQNSHIQGIASEISGSLIIMGSTHVNPSAYDTHVGQWGRFELTILNRKTLAVEYAQAWSPTFTNFGDSYPTIAALYEQAYQEVKKYEGNNNYIVIYTAAALYCQTPPSPYLSNNFYNFLQNCGAGNSLQNWTQNYTWYSGDPGPLYTHNVNYILMGICGTMPGSGIEGFTSFTIGAGAKGPDPLSMYTFLEPHYDDATGTFYGYGLEKMAIPIQRSALAVSHSPSMDEAPQEVRSNVSVDEVNAEVGLQSAEAVEPEPVA